MNIVLETLASGLSDLAKRRRIEDQAHDTKRKTIVAVPTVYVSELGKCPWYLYFRLAGEIDRPYVSDESAAFLDDGLWHEDRTVDYLRPVLREGFILQHNEPAVVATVPTATGSGIRVSGKPDVVISAEGHVVQVMEHKAVKEHKFKQYETDPASIPNAYKVQAATYAHLLGAVEGAVLLFRNRNDGSYFPNPHSLLSSTATAYDRGQCAEIYAGATLDLQSIAEGNMEQFARRVHDDCWSCPMKSKCFPELRSTGNPKGEVFVVQPGEDTDGLATLIARYKDADELYDLYTSRRIEVKDLLKAYMEQRGLRGLKSNMGSVSLITKSGTKELTSESKSRVKELIESGELATYVTNPVSYVTYRGVK